MLVADLGTPTVAAEARLSERIPANCLPGEHSTACNQCSRWLRCSHRSAPLLQVDRPFQYGAATSAFFCCNVSSAITQSPHTCPGACCLKPEAKGCDGAPACYSSESIGAPSLKVRT